MEQLVAVSSLHSREEPNSELSTWKVQRLKQLRATGLARKLKDRRLQSFGTTLKRLGFRRRPCHEPSQCKCYVKFFSLKPKLIWVGLESLLIFVRCVPVWNGCNLSCVNSMLVYKTYVKVWVFVQRFTYLVLILLSMLVETTWRELKPECNMAKSSSPDLSSSVVWVSFPVMASVYFSKAFNSRPFVLWLGLTSKRSCLLCNSCKRTKKHSSRKRRGLPQSHWYGLATLR